MQKKQVTIVPTSMQQDIAPNQYPANAALEVKNMRFVTIDENNATLCISNEKGNKKIELSNPILGTVIGYEDFEDFIVLFSTNSVEVNGEVIKTDYIYRLESKIVNDSEIFDVAEIYSGKLNFSETSPIESVKVIENTNVQKVYWVDGINPPRVINVAKGVEYSQDETQFNFFPNLSFKDSLFEVTKKDNYSGYFVAGVVQYAVVYYNKNGSSTPVVNTSSLYYISEEGKGLAPNSKTSCCFEIKLGNPDVELFKYAKVYRLYRGSLNAVPEVVVLPYVKFMDDNTSTIIDDGIVGSSASSTELIFLKIFDIIPSTLAVKDNTLFLGNYKDNNYNDTLEEVKRYFNSENVVQCGYEYVNTNTSDNDWEALTPYNYKGSLNEPRNKITFFQKDETYRFGVQLMNKKGVWSDVIYLGDYVNQLRVKPKSIDEGIAKRPIFKINIANNSKLSDYIAIRPVCVYPTELDRTVVCQGLVVPTVYNMYDRVDNSPYVQSSWFARPNYLNNSKFSKLYYKDNPNISVPKGGGAESEMIINRNHNFGFPLEYRMISNNTLTLLPPADHFNSEIQYSKELTTSIISKTLSKEDRLEMITDKGVSCSYGIDKSIVTLHSPELDLNYSTGFANLPLKNLKFRIVGLIPVKNTLSNLDVTAENIFNFNQGFGFNYSDPNKKTSIINTEDGRKVSTSGLSVNTFPFWVDTTYIYDKSVSEGDMGIGVRFHTSFPIYAWHRQGSLNNEGKNIGRHSILKSKILSNLRVGLPTIYFNDEEANVLNDFKTGDIKYFNSDVKVATRLNLWGKELIYYGNSDRVLTPTAKDKYPIYINAYMESASASSIMQDEQKVQDLDALVNFGAEDVKGDLYQKYITYDEVLYKGQPILDAVSDYFSEIDRYSKDNIDMSYKSTPHVVIGLDKTEDAFNLLPSIKLASDIPANEDEENNDNIEVFTKIFDIKFRNNSEEGRDLNYDGYYGRECTQQSFGLGLASFVTNGGLFRIRFEITNMVGERIKSVTLKCSVAQPSMSGWFKNYVKAFDNVAYFKYSILNFTVNNHTYAFDNEDTFPSLDWASPEEKEVLVKPISYIEDFKYCIRVDNDSESNNISFTIGRLSYWAVVIEGITIHTVKEVDGEEVSTETNLSFKKTGTTENPIKNEVIFDWSNRIISGEYYGYTEAPGDESITQPADDDNLIWQEKNDNFAGFKQNTLSVDKSFFNNIDTDNLYYFLIGELYRPNIFNKFGGVSEEALANNQWEVCGETQVIRPTDNNIVITATEGDTYYQRYDHLKTYPWNKDKTNSIVEIVSFGCETRINIDGRYDNFRGRKDNTIIDPSIFNLYNSAYSQKNNYFTATYLNKDNHLFKEYPDGVLWSNPKSYGEEIDSFTNLIGANSVRLDSLYGPLNKLVTIGNDIFAFQDKGISKILYNNRVQIQANDGIPIELSNSGKVDGKFYISNTHGCKNKWSLVNTPTGVYFIDDYTRSIMQFNGESLVDLSYTKNMFNWVYKKANLKMWNPKDFDSIRTYYDPYNNDIYFTSKENALCFSEKLGKFSSFYDYGEVAGFINFNGNSYQIYDGKFYKLHGETDYCKFFDKEIAEYSIEVVANPEFTTDKIFEAVEFRTNDTFEKTAHRQRNNNSASVPFSNVPFDTMIVHNEYQTAVSNRDKLIKKFRTWRWEINRAKYGNKYIGWTKSRDRIRNPWTKIKLKGKSDKLLQLYDMVVTYYN